MAEKKKNPVVLKCPPGCPCCDTAPPPPDVTTDVIVEVREAGVSSSNPIDASRVEVTLTSIDKSRELKPATIARGPAGQMLATFKAVPQGWYRALAVRNGVDGAPESSAARNVQVVKIKGKGSEEPQHTLLVITKQGVARFVFVTDLNDAPLANTNVIVRHPDGVEQRHTTNGAGEIRIPAAAGDLFEIARIEHPVDNAISSAQEEELS